MPEEPESVPSPGIANVPPPAPPSQPDPNAPPQDPAPAKPPDPPKPTFRSLDEDLAEFAKETPEAPPPKPKAKPKPKAPPKPPEEGQTPPEEPAEPPETPPGGDDEDFLGVPKPKEKPKPGEEKPPEEPATGPLKAPELRAEYKRVKERLAEAEKELASYKTSGQKPEEGEKKAYLEQIEALNKKIEEQNAIVKAVAYEQSDEYKQKYEQPFVEAWNEGVQLVSSLNVQDQEGNTRRGTPQDFAAIMQVPDNEQAATMAQEMFGQNAFYVLAQRRDIHRLHAQRVKAIEDFRTNMTEREKQHLEQAQKQQKEQEAQRTEAQVLFKKLNTEAAKQYPEFFGPIEGDDEGNALLEKGYKDADLMFSGARDLPLERRVRLHSAIRNRAAAFGRLVHRIKTKDAEIEALKAELEEIRGSEPGAGQEGRTDAKPRQLTADEEIEAAAMRTQPR